MTTTEAELMHRMAMTVRDDLEEIAHNCEEVEAEHAQDLDPEERRALLHWAEDIRRAKPSAIAWLVPDEEG